MMSDYMNNNFKVSSQEDQDLKKWAIEQANVSVKNMLYGLAESASCCDAEDIDIIKVAKRIYDYVKFSKV